MTDITDRVKRIERIRELDELAYSRIVERGLDPDKPILSSEGIHGGSNMELAQRYLMNNRNWSFSLDEVRRLHGLIYCGTNELSDYKSEENLYVTDSVVVSIPALPEETPAAMEEWYEKYRNFDNLETIICAENDMCTIHPFTDGNGRTAFCLMRAMMHSIGYRCALHLNIDKFVYSKMSDYILIIRKTTGCGWGLQQVNYDVYIEFMLPKIEAAYNELCDFLNR